MIILIKSPNIGANLDSIFQLSPNLKSRFKLMYNIHIHILIYKYYTFRVTTPLRYLTGAC